MYNNYALCNLLPQPLYCLTKSLTIKLYRLGFKTHILAKALGVSYRTVWKWIVKARNGRKIGRKGWSRRLPRIMLYYGVKIKKIQTIQNIFYRLWEDFQNGEEIDLDKIIKEEIEKTQQNKKKDDEDKEEDDDGV
jgi:hypothetical protein